jgi:hypothetical protein
MPPKNNQAAIARRLGLGVPDARGPQGMLSRGANVYRGGLPNAQMGPGNPNMGRPPMGPPPMGGPQGGQMGGPPMGPPPGAPPIGRPGMMPVGGGVSPSQSTLTGLVGSLPPGGGNQDGTMNDAIMALLRSRLGQPQGVPLSG